MPCRARQARVTPSQVTRVALAAKLFKRRGKDWGQAMVSLEVYRNDERLCVAGIGDFGVLTACVNWVAHSPDRLEQWATEGVSEQPAELNLQVGGLKTNERLEPVQMRWIDTNLRVGDEIRIHIIDAPRVDTATTEYRDDPVKDAELKKTYVRRMARELGWEIRER
jgi:hypothetical protein